MMEDGDEGFEEWDANFLDQVIRVEEQVLSAASAAASQPPPPTSQPTRSYLPPPPQPPPPRPHQSRLYAPPSHSYAAPLPPPPPINYSPPRELSQRAAVVYPAKPSSHQPPNGRAFPAVAPSSSVISSAGSSREHHGRKKETGRVSKQLAPREREHVQLRKGREEKEEQLKSAFPYTQRNVSNSLNDISDFRCSREVDDASVQATPAHRAIGVQTEATGLVETDDRHARQKLSLKLFSVWGPPFDRKVNNDLVSKLFATSYGLFRSIGLDVASRIKLDSSAYANLGFLSNPKSLKDSDIPKVSRFYSVLLKISDGMAPLEALLDPLVDLCVLDNIIVIYRSLCVLHLILKHLSSMKRKPEPRDNIKIEGSLTRDNMAEMHQADGPKTAFPFSVNFDETSMIPDSSLGFKSSGDRSWLRNGQWSNGSTVTSLRVDWVALFELMHQIIKKNKEESIRLEAVCIMNLILLRSSSYTEREKFGIQTVFESISELLKKDCGSRVQYQALHLLFLLVNCPKILDKFCSGCKDTNHPFSVDKILQGLAGCMGSRRNGVEDLQLRRKAIILLSFLGSYGVAGFEILTNHQLPDGANFLMLILQELLTEWDAEAAGSIESLEIPKERTLILREGLILMNRLVSNPDYSSVCLRLLTSSRDMVSLTADVVSRTSQTQPRFGQVESTNGQSGESEVVDLARTFKKKIFAYLGDIL